MMSSIQMDNDKNNYDVGNMLENYFKFKLLLRSYLVLDIFFR